MGGEGRGGYFADLGLAVEERVVAEAREAAGAQDLAPEEGDGGKAESEDKEDEEAARYSVLALAISLFDMDGCVCICIIEFQYLI